MVAIMADDACASQDGKVPNAQCVPPNVIRSIVTGTGSAYKACAIVCPDSRALDAKKVIVPMLTVPITVLVSMVNVCAKLDGLALIALKLINELVNFSLIARHAACTISTHNGAFASLVGLATIVHLVSNRTLFY